jgi:hypothetical protein
VAATVDVAKDGWMMREKRGEKERRERRKKGLAPVQVSDQLLLGG